jgi:hypothetical protein
MASEFDAAVLVESPEGPVAISNAQEAFLLLSGPHWPRRDLLQKEAIETALKVMDGHRSAVDARDALVRAARSAGNLLQETPS